MVTTSPETISVDEAARRLGIHRTTAYAAVKRGELPHIRIGDRILIPLPAFEKLLKEGHKEKPLGS